MVLLVLAALAAPRGDAGARELGTFGAWRAYTFEEGTDPVCSMWSQPLKAEGRYTRRGEIFAFVTHRPGERRFDDVSFEIGYPFKEGSVLVVTVDGKHRFELKTNASTAWLDDRSANRRLVARMKAGAEMVAEGISRRGTHTRDTYSLKGFTAAHRAISEACGAARR